MVAWIPAFKTLLPYVTQIVTLAVPAFTTRTEGSGSQEVVHQQIQELQEAAVRNTEAVKGLASQLQKGIADIDAGAVRIEKELHKIRQLCIIAITISGVAIVLSVVALLVKI